MANKPAPTWLMDDVADFLASCPTREGLLAYRPSRSSQERLRTLLDKSKKGALDADEEWELNQFEHLEVLLQAVKARLRTRRSVPS
jgi:hypothetical protein